MAIDPRKRQKKLQRKASKDKAKKKALTYRKLHETEIRLAGAAKASVLHAVCGDTVFDSQGMGTVLLSRRLTDGQVAFALFLLDVYCLGVKQAFAKICSYGEYMDQVYSNPDRPENWVTMQPEGVRKLVEGAVAYAAQFGFKPDPDYAEARLLFGDLDPGACSEEFTYGCNGKPRFIAGPYDNAVRCQYILDALQKHCGDGNYDYVMETAQLAPHLDFAGEVEHDEEDDEDDIIDGDQPPAGPFLRYDD